MSIKWPSFARAQYWRFRQRGKQVLSWDQLADTIAQDTIAQTAAQRPQSIAIVGNAGYLTDLALGRQIDGCDLVVRMNNCQIDGFESSVGRKTDIYLSNFFYDIDFANPAIQSAKHIVSSRPNVFRKQPKRHIKQRFGEHLARGMVQGKMDCVYAPSRDAFCHWCAQLRQEPTTGWMAIMLALETLASSVDRVFVAGFSFFEGKSHYFSDETVTPFHNISEERVLLCERLRAEVLSGRVQCDPLLTQKLGLEDNGLRIAI